MIEQHHERIRRSEYVPDIKVFAWMQILRDESSALIMDEHLAEAWKRDNPRMYEAGSALADLLRMVFCWFVKKLNRYHARGPVQNHGISSSPPSQIEALPAQPSFLTYFDLAIPPHWPKPEPIDETAPFIGGMEKTVLGRKFKLLDDAYEFQRIMSGLKAECTIFWSPDPGMPYEVISTDKFLYLTSCRGNAIN